MKDWKWIALAAAGFIGLMVAANYKGGDQGQASTTTTANKDSVAAAERAALIAELPGLIRDFDASKFTGKPAEVAAGAFALELIRNRLKMAQADKHPDAAKWAAMLKAMQAKAYPALRAAWAKTANTVMWENNIEVEAQGRAATSVLFTGGTFANNKNIATVQESISEQVKQLRFKRVKYRWYKHDDEAQYYDIDSPVDTDVE